MALNGGLCAVVPRCLRVDKREIRAIERTVASRVIILSEYGLPIGLQSSTCRMSFCIEGEERIPS